MHNRKDKLITERLVLRKLKNEDATPMHYNWCNDPEVAKYTLWVAHKDLDVTKNLVDMWIEEEKAGKTIRFVIVLKENDEPIGAIDIVHFYDGIPEVGYCLSRKCWGKGYMTEACKAFVNYLFELGYPKVLIRADLRNVGSLKVIEKCGFKYTHDEKIEHRSEVRPESVVVRWYEMCKEK